MAVVACPAGMVRGHGGLGEEGNRFYYLLAGIWRMVVRVWRMVVRVWRMVVRVWRMVVRVYEDAS